MKKCCDQCFLVNIPVQELLDNLNESFASSIVEALNIAKLDSRDFQIHFNAGNLEFYRTVVGGDDA